MSGFRERRFLPFVLLAASFLAIPAFAQFEIAPDHFDGSDQQRAKQKPSVKPQAKPVRPAAVATAHPPSVPAIATAVTKRNPRPRSEQQIARRSKADVELASCHR